MASQATTSLIDPQMFIDLQEKLSDDSKIRDQLRDIVQELERTTKVWTSALSNAYREPTASSAVDQARRRCGPAMSDQFHRLRSFVNENELPYHKFNGLWTRQIQDSVLAIIYDIFLEPLLQDKVPKLLSLDEVADLLHVPVNAMNETQFHLTVEEYLQALVSLIDELARLARNSVTLGNYSRPVIISQFVKDLHAGFQLLNLKNDSLRRRVDGIKYKVREVEDVVYDLSLRNLIPKPS